MVGPHSPLATRIRVLAGGREQASRTFGRLVPHVGLELGIDAATYHFGNGDAQPSGSALDPPVLCGFELYLKTHHDGIIIPS